MAINAEWHKGHRMPKNATVEQRVEWHTAHLKECSCRTDVPKSLQQYFKR